MSNLSKNVKVTRLMNGVVAGTDDVQSSSILDMSGWDGVVFLVALGTITATGTCVCSVQTGDNSALSDAAAMSGLSVSYTASDDNKVAVIDLYRPVERYTRCQLTRATANVVIDGVIAVQYKGREMPTTHDSTTVVGADLGVSPVES